MSCKRCYKDAWQRDEVFSYMKEGASSQFDPEIISVLLNCEAAVRGIYEEYS